MASAAPGRGSKWLNRGTMLGLIAGAVVATAITTLFVLARPQSALTIGLGGGTWVQLTATFDARIKKRFPLDMPIWDVTNTLVAQGFEPGWHGGRAGEFMASRDESSLVCNIPAEVYWTVTPQGRLASIRGV